MDVIVQENKISREAIKIIFKGNILMKTKLIKFNIQKWRTVLKLLNTLQKTQPLIGVALPISKIQKLRYLTGQFIATTCEFSSLKL